MKHIKKFEAVSKEDKMKDNVDLLIDLLHENPNYETHDFYVFIAREDFKEVENGLYKKSITIENMVIITPDEHGVTSMAGLQIRARFQTDSELYQVWLPKELRKDIEGKTSSEIEPYIVDIIDKYKTSGSDDTGRKVYNDVVQRRKDISKFNL